MSMNGGHGMTALSSRCEAAGSPSSGRIWGGKSEAGLISYASCCALSSVTCAFSPLGLVYVQKKAPQFPEGLSIKVGDDLLSH